jgi:hypothetical protein
MVPAIVIGLDALPMTGTGKVDRQALPRPAGDDWLDPTRFAAPQSDMERLIVAVWGELLQLELVGIHDNFFDLGGHSLLLVQVHSRLEALLGRTLPMVDMFRFPTVEALAAHLKLPEPGCTLRVADPLDAVDERVQRQRAARAQRMQRRQT